MKKTSLILCIAMIFSLFVSSFSFVSAAAVSLSDTRYRIPMVKFELPSFKSGQPIFKGANKSYVNHSDADSTVDLFKATVEKYDLLGSTNKALQIHMLNQPSAVDKFMKFTFNPNKKTQTNQLPLKGISNGISVNSTENGFMYYVDMSNLKYHGKNEKTGEPENYDNYSITLKPIIQEFDLNKDGTPRIAEDGLKVVTPWTYKTDADITLIWTKAVNYQKDGKPFVRKVGDVETIQAGKPDLEYISFPGNFCGYVVSPFSSMHPGQYGWEGTDLDGLVNLQKIDCVAFNFGLWPQEIGDIWFDDIAFYGPAFSEIEGALDYGTALSNTNYSTGKPVTAKKPVATDDDEPKEKPAAPTGDKNKVPATESTIASTDVSTDANVLTSSEEILNQESKETENQSNDQIVNNKNNSAFPWWGWLIIGVVIVAGAGVGVFFFMKKKNGTESDEVISDGEDGFASDEVQEIDDSQDEDSQK